MQLDSLLKDYVEFNLWANSKMVGWLREKPAALLYQEVHSSFPSLEKTLLHICDGETVWLERLCNRKISEFPSNHFKGDAEEVFSAVVASSQKFRDFVVTLGINDFSTPCTYLQFNGEPHTTPVGEIIQHCMNHGTFHRGQLVTMGRSLGLADPPKTDFIHYLREKNNAG